MKIVFDIDDTICHTINRDYINSIPNREVIDKINNLFDLGFTISLYTSRGMNSCKGDLTLIKERNEQILIDWLNKYKVKYNELIFGKPLADLYVDDKGVSLEEFKNLSFKELKGHSGCKIVRVGDKVIKQGDNLKKQYDWYKQVEGSHINIPKIYSFTVDTIIMSFINGELLSTCLNSQRLSKLIRIIKSFKHFKMNAATNIQAYFDYLLKIYPTSLTNDLINKLKTYEKYLINNASFCHGDLSLNNVILRKKKLYLIDPNIKEDYSSWLLDLAKLRYSLSGYDKEFGFTDLDLTCYLEEFDNSFSKKTRDVVKLLEITRWIRVLPFTRRLKPEKEQFMIDKINQLWSEVQ